MVKRPTQAEQLELRALEIAEELFELVPDLRNRRLDESCGDDEVLRRRVSALLTAEQVGDFPLPVDLPLVEAFQPDGHSETIALGATVGTFRIEETIATGGMGDVYVARQEHPKRQVALKTLRLNLTSVEARNRFRNEAEITAALAHPGIAQVFEAGVHVENSALGQRTVPFFTMEFIEGARSLSNFVRNEELDRNRIIQLFLEVLAAVEHAHARGIIHRDLKSSNVLVGSDGKPKLIDFGIARATNPELDLATVETLAGGMLGTLRCMSPEQVEGKHDQVDARSDVYALGVMLYELLCGTHPLDVSDNSSHAWARAILEQAPIAPRRRAPSLDAELEVVLLKALEKEPGRRYQTVQLFADDLERILASEPIAARPPTVSRKLSLFGRRHRASVVAAVAILIVVAIAIASNQASSRQAEQDSALAERRTDDVHRLASELLFEVHDALEGLPGATAAREKVVRSSLSTLDRLAEDLGDDPRLRRELSDAYARLGRVLAYPTVANLGDTDGGLAAYSKALSHLDALKNDDELRARRVHLLRETAAALRQAGRMSDALVEQLSGLEIARVLNNEPQLLVAALAQTGDTLLELGRTSEAETHFEDALALATQNKFAHDEHVLLNKLGDLALAQQDRGTALDYFTRSLSLAEQFASKDSKDVRLFRDLGASLGRVGNLALESGQPQLALQHFERALNDANARVSFDEFDAVAQADAARTLTWVGAAYAALGDGAQALATRIEAARMYGALADDDPGNIEARFGEGVALISLAETQRDLRQPSDALATIRAAIYSLGSVLAVDDSATEPRLRMLVALDVECSLLRDTNQLLESLEVTARYQVEAESACDQNPDHIGFLRQRMVAEDRMGMIHQALGNNTQLPKEERIIHFTEATTWYERTLASSQEIEQSGQKRPGDEVAWQAIIDEFAVIVSEIESLR